MAEEIKLLNNHVYKGGEPIEVGFYPDLQGAGGTFASVIFTAGVGFGPIADGVTFTLFNKIFTTGVDIDLSSTIHTVNMEAFANLLYSTYEFIGLFHPPSNYNGEYSIVDGTNAVCEIQWNEAGVIDPFVFDVSSLTLMSSVSTNGVDYTGRKNYGVIYKVLLGFKEITRFLFCPILHGDYIPSNYIDEILYPIVRFRNLPKGVIDTINFSLLEPDVYKEFHLMYGDRWTTDECNIVISKLKKSKLIRVLGHDHSKGLMTNIKNKTTLVCKGKPIVISMVGGLGNDTGIHKGEIRKKVNGSVVETIDQFLYTKVDVLTYIHQYEEGNESVKFTYIYDMVLDGQIGFDGDTHEFIYVDCSCSSQFYYLSFDGSWSMARLEQIKETTSTKRESVCDDLDMVSDIQKTFEYSGDFDDIVQLIMARKVYVWESGFKPVSILTDSASDETTIKLRY